MHFSSSSKTDLNTRRSTAARESAKSHALTHCKEKMKAFLPSTEQSRVAQHLGYPSTARSATGLNHRQTTKSTPRPKLCPKKTTTSHLVSLSESSQTKGWKTHVIPSAILAKPEQKKKASSSSHALCYKSPFKLQPTKMAI